VLEFQDEGNNVSSIDLPIRLAPPPDLQVTAVTAPDAVIAGQAFSVAYSVKNVGGKTPNDQGTWYDMVYLSKDRFLDINKDRYLGYATHSGGLPAGAGYDGSFTFTAPRDLEGPYYVFVVDRSGARLRHHRHRPGHRVRQRGQQRGRRGAADAIETPPPADLVVTDVVVPATATVGQDVEISFTVKERLARSRRSAAGPTRSISRPTTPGTWATSCSARSPTSAISTPTARTAAR
jgi:hypothetical protein